MGHYTYKDLCYGIPAHYEETFEEKYNREFDYDFNYNGDYWTIASDYVTDLEKRISEYQELVDMDDEERYDKLIELSGKEVWED